MIPLNEEKEICNKYISGKSCPKLGLEYNVDKSFILRILKKNNIKIRTSSESHKGQVPWNTGTKGIKKANSGSFGKRNIVGKNHPRWRGGITKFTFQIRNSNKYINWRTQIFGRDNFTCQECRIRGTWLEAHHIKKFSVIIKENKIKTLEESIMCNELWNLDNGITLCKKCHNETKRIIKINRRE